MFNYGKFDKTIYVSIVVLLFIMMSPLAMAESPDLIILHTNDIHGRIEEGEGMGMAKLATIVQEFRNKYNNVLLVDAGDTIHGLPIANEVQGVSVVRAMNAVGYDVMVPGNHDFNFGFRRLLELEEKMDYHLIAANIYQNNQHIFPPYHILEFDDFRVGFFGLTTPDTYNVSNPRNIRGLEFCDLIEVSSSMVELLQGKDVDLIVALGHVGLHGDFTSTAVIDEVAGIDVFVDGHSHHRLEEGMWYEETLIVQAFEYIKCLGVVEITFTDNGPIFNAYLISDEQAQSYEDDPILREILDEAEAEWIEKRFK